MSKKKKIVGFVTGASAAVGAATLAKSKKFRELNEAHGGNVREVASLVATEVKEGAHYMLDKTVAASEGHVDKVANKLANLTEEGRAKAKNAAHRAQVSVDEAEAKGKADKLFAAREKAIAAKNSAKRGLADAREKIKEHHAEDKD